MTKQELKSIIEEAYYEVLSANLVVEAEGDDKKARAAYIKLRAQ